MTLEAPTPQPPQDAGGPNTYHARQVATCSGCVSTWTGLNMAHCATCHHTFGSVKSFDVHRRTGRCAHPTTIDLTWNAVRHCWSEAYHGPR